MFSPQQVFFSNCLKALAQQNYKKAFKILETGLGKSIINIEKIDKAEFFKHLHSVLTFLDYQLEEDFGSKWKKPLKPKKEEEIKCSFCSKNPSDVQKIVAGPSSYICDECVNVCYQIISEDMKLLAKKKAKTRSK